MVITEYALELLREHDLRDDMKSVEEEGDYFDDRECETGNTSGNGFIVEDINYHGSSLYEGIYDND